MNIQEIIVSTITDIMHEQDKELILPLLPDTVLLECGMDSLGFAILVARLEDELGYDPFVLMEEAFYPQTLQEFVGIYDKYKSHAQG